jgi:hypothetical protein
MSPPLSHADCTNEYDDETIDETENRIQGSPNEQHGSGPKLREDHSAFVPSLVGSVRGSFPGYRPAPYCIGAVTER